MRVAVFCASSNGIDPAYYKDARELGEKIGRLGWQLIYGGTDLGLMREVADATMKNGGQVTGIIPECIQKRGIGATGLSQLIVASDMKERKYLLREHADAFIALPGGWGTLEEITEVITLKQLGEHQKPVLFLNTEGFYNGFIDFIRNIRDQGFISSGYDRLYGIVENAEEAIQYLKRYRIREIENKY